ncbi:MAG TPA: polysaccharide biosynthesis C-terminal domain-containing protein [Bacteroidales bacterium]|nr:polysaccharide biosynthesis C-terminal domain-containing protein [Bacteroidales bacterium]
MILNIVLDLGLTSFNNRNIAQNHNLLRKHFSNTLIVKLLLSVVYTVVVFLVGFFYGLKGHEFILLGAMSFNQFLLSLILYLRSNISGLLLFRVDSLLSVMDRILAILLVGIMLFIPTFRSSFTIEWFVWAQTAAYGFTAMTAFVIVVSKAGLPKITWNWPFYMMVMRQSLPFAVLVLLMSLYNRLDPLLLGALLPDSIADHQTGIYAQAYRLLDTATMIAYLFSVLLLPLFANMLARKVTVQRLVRLSFSLLFAGSVLVSVATWFFKMELIELLYPQTAQEGALAYGEKVQLASTLLGLLMTGFIAISSTYVVGTLLTADGRMKALNITAAAGMVLSVLLNWVLIPHYLSVGSGIASVVTQYITAGVQVYLAYRYFKFRFDLLFVGRLALYPVLLIGLGFLIRELSYNWLTELGLFVAFGLLISFLLKLINIPYLVDLLKGNVEGA